jgi:hypothetical protein
MKTAPERKVLAALETVVYALAPLDPESRRRVVEALHTLLPVGLGRQGADKPARGARRKAR